MIFRFIIYGLLLFIINQILPNFAINPLSAIQEGFALSVNQYATMAAIAFITELFLLTASGNFLFTRFNKVANIARAIIFFAISGAVIAARAGHLPELSAAFKGFCYNTSLQSTCRGFTELLNI